MEIPGLTFKTKKEIEILLKMNTTDKMRDDIKIIGKEQDVYNYNSKIKL